MDGIAAGMARRTRQRARLLALLARTPDFRSAQQLHASLQGSGAAVGLTTVYRTLQLLAEAGEVDQVRLPGGERLYRRCAVTWHHHHLVCRRCGAAAEIIDPSVEHWAQQPPGDHGFTSVSHAIDIFGLCARCSPR